MLQGAFQNGYYISLSVIARNISMDSQEYFKAGGTRLVWNTMPSSPLLASKVGVPQAVHHSLLTPATLLLSPPPSCPKCKGVASKHCTFQLSTYTCLFCQSECTVKESFDPSILETDHFQYPFQGFKGKETVLLFVVDLTVEEEDLAAIKATLVSLLQKAEDSTRVGLITFHRLVFVHDLSSSIGNIMCFAPTKRHSPHELASFLGLELNMQTASQQSFRYLPRLGDSRIALIDKVEQLPHLRQKSLNRQGKSEREVRAVGQAIAVGINLLDLSPEKGRIILLAGGPCTVGVGKIVDPSYHDTLRASLESANELTKSAVDFYDRLKVQLVNSRIVFDAYLFSVQGAGLAELYPLISASGGLVFLEEQFRQPNFSSSFIDAYSSANVLGLSTEATLEIKCSKNILLNGLLGPCEPYPTFEKNLQQLHVSEEEVGCGGTNKWYLGGVDSQRTVTVAIELDTTVESNTFEMQFILTYQCSTRKMPIRQVSTIQRRISPRIENLAQGFDSEAAVLLLARLCLNKEQPRKWIDQTLGRWLKFFALVSTEIASFDLPKSMKHFLQYIYHLRRNSILYPEKTSCDEYTYRKHMINRESVHHALLMIQPALLEYSFDCPTHTPRSLSAAFMKDEVILLIDTFFNVVQWHGKQIAEWVSEGVHLKGDHAHVTTLIAAPEEDVRLLTTTKFPRPNYYLTQPGASRERYLKSALHSGMNEAQIYTEAIDLETFTSYLNTFLLANQ